MKHAFIDYESSFYLAAAAIIDDSYDMKSLKLVIKIWKTLFFDSIEINK